MLCEWPAWAGPVSRMSLLRATVTVVPSAVSWHNFINKRNAKESNLPVSFIGRIENMARL